MKTTLNRFFGFLVIVFFLAGSCMNSDLEDYPDFSEQLIKDLDAIDEYLATNNVAGVKQDPDGLIRYVVYRDSTSTPKPTLDSCAVVNYAGFLLSNGQKFDDGENFAFPVNGVIDGWRIGIPLLNVGDSVTFYIPSGLGYGYHGFQPEIPSNANLIFHVGLKKVGDTFKQGTSTTPGSCD